MAVAELWETLKHAIEAYTGLSPATFFTVLALAEAYTGLSPATFFTVLALAAAVYHVVSGFFQPPPAPRKREVEFEAVEPLPPPVQLGEITEEELKAYDGSDPKRPLLMAIRGQIYDVTQSRQIADLVVVEISDKSQTFPGITEVLVHLNLGVTDQDKEYAYFLRPCLQHHRFQPFCIHMITQHREKIRFHPS